MNNNKPPLLLLVHRIPFPPNKGDKIRSFHVLKHLSQTFRVYLGAFVDDPDDWQYASTLDTYCEEVKLLKLNPTTSKIKALKAFFTNAALSIPYYFQSELQSWIDQVVAKESIQHAFVYCSSMAQYVEKHTQLKRILDMVDVDSDKWRQYADSKTGLARWVYRREWKTLADCEKSIVKEMDFTYLVSEKEAELLQTQLPESKSKIGYFNNGVDLAFFDPALSYANPYTTDKKHIVFTGAMDYWANVDAVIWFANKVMPLIQQQEPNLHFSIVGSRPTKDVLQLASDNITVTGRVEDIRQYIFHADAIIAPMQIARGIQNKVLEALAMNKNVVTTSAAYEGLLATSELDALCHDDPKAFAKTCLELLEHTQARANWREYVIQNYSWDSCLSVIDEKLLSETESV